LAAGVILKLRRKTSFSFPGLPASSEWKPSIDGHIFPVSRHHCKVPGVSFQRPAVSVSSGERRECTLTALRLNMALQHCRLSGWQVVQNVLEYLKRCWLKLMYHKEATDWGKRN
jgi:hypothetical protein